MPMRYRVVGFVTYADERGRRCPIPVGAQVEVRSSADGGGTMTWQDGSGRAWSEPLSDRLLAHYTMSHLERIGPQEEAVGRYARWNPRAAPGDFKYRRRA